MLTLGFNLLALVADVPWNLEQIVVTADTRAPLSSHTSVWWKGMVLGDPAGFRCRCYPLLCGSIRNPSFLYLSGGQNNVFQGLLRPQ